jgi:hypothetical protein
MLNAEITGASKAPVTSDGRPVGNKDGCSCSGAIGEGATGG